MRGNEPLLACAVVALGAELVVDAGGDALAVVPDDELEDEAGVDDPELDPLEELLLELPFEPPSGSVYCWSPAEGPVARAVGASSITAVSTTSR